MMKSDTLWSRLLSGAGFQKVSNLIFTSRAAGDARMDMVPPAILGLNEEQFKFVAVETHGDGSVFYTGITHSGGAVVLSLVGNSSELLPREITELPQHKEAKQQQAAKLENIALGVKQPLVEASKAQSTLRSTGQKKATQLSQAASLSSEYLPDNHKIDPIGAETDSSQSSTNAFRIGDQLNFRTAFPNANSKQISTIETLVESAPAQLESRGGQLVLAQKEPPKNCSAGELAALVGALKSHAQQLITECDQKQVPEEVKRRLGNYLDPLDQDAPVFLMLDAPMSFIQGSLTDNYVTDALDGGFVEALRLLVKMHEQLRYMLVDADNAEEKLPDLLPEIGAKDAIDLTDSAIKALDDPSVGQEIIEALNAAKDYFEFAQQNNPNLLKRGIAAVGAIVSGAIAGACGTALYVWATSPGGVAVIERLQPVLDRLLAFFA